MTKHRQGGGTKGNHLCRHCGDAAATPAEPVDFKAGFRYYVLTPANPGATPTGTETVHAATNQTGQVCRRSDCGFNPELPRHLVYIRNPSERDPQDADPKKAAASTAQPDSERQGRHLGRVLTIQSPKPPKAARRTSR